jgi:ribose transport system substrate-binding protein
MKKEFFKILIALLITISLIFLVTRIINSKSLNRSIPKKFGATYMSMDNPFFEELNSAVQEIVEANGDVLISRNPSQSQEKQNQQIFDMIDLGIDLLFINPVDWEKVMPALEACRNANIPIVNIDTNVFDTSYVDSIIISNNYQAGIQIANDVKAKREKARIVILSHNSVYSTYERIRGFMDTLETFDGDYEIVYKQTTSVTFESSMEVMLDFLTKDIPFDVVIGGNDPTALGALAAMQKCNIKDDTLIYGIDGSPLGKAMIKQGYLEGTSAQFPIKIGKKSAEIAYDILNGVEVSHNILIPVELITKENLYDFDIAGWQ